jgi:hypothetical protein
MDETAAGAAAKARPAAPDPGPGRGPGAGVGDALPDPAPHLADPRFLQVLSTEHWSLLTARSLAYNEAFTRASMFLTFLSMSFVALALVGPPLAFSRDFLVIAAILLAFDVLVGALTFIRVAACNSEDFRAMQGMNRIRHGYVQVVPRAEEYFITGTHDDADTVAAEYGEAGETSQVVALAYGLSTSLGLVGLVLSLVSGILGGIVSLLLNAGWPLPILGGAVAFVAVFAACSVWALRAARRFQASLRVRFPRTPLPPLPPRG